MKHKQLSLSVVLLVLPAFLCASTFYVSHDGSHSYPYGSWDTASTSIAAALTHAVDGDEVYVTNGTYLLASQLNITNAISVQSVNGAEFTILDGRNANRCVFMGHRGAVVKGFTITNGFLLNRAGGSPIMGAGIDCRAGLVERCIIVGNRVATEEPFSVAAQAGGFYCAADGRLLDSKVAGNWAESTAGGGLCAGIMERCVVVGNRATNIGGVGLAMGGTARSCTIVDNAASNICGGASLADGALLENCVVAGNRAESAGGIMLVHEEGTIRNSTIACNDAATCGGLLVGPLCTHATVVNTIIAQNSGGNIAGRDSIAEFSYSCVAPLVSGTGNITNDPQLTPCFRLKRTSPCIDSGTASEAPATDIDGEARWDHPGHSNLVSIVDIGADEFVDTDSDDMADHWEDETFGSTTNSSGTADGDDDDLNDLGEYENSTDPDNADTDADQMPDGWEVGNNLDPLTDDANHDPDADTMNNGGEYAADTDPHDADSVLSLIRIDRQLGGIRLDWKGGREAWQILQCREDLTSTTEQWTAIFAIPPPTPMTNAIVDLGVTNKTLFYRIRAER